MNVNSFEQGPSNHSYTNSFVHWWIEKMPLGRKSTNSCIPRMTIFLDGRVRFSKVLLLLAEKHHSLYLFIMFTAFPFVRLTAHFHPFTPSSPGQTIPPWLPLATGAVLGRNPFASLFWTFLDSWANTTRWYRENHNDPASDQHQSGVTLSSKSVLQTINYSNLFSMQKFSPLV